jgi:hypothetical protein
MDPYPMERAHKVHEKAPENDSKIPKGNYSGPHQFAKRLLGMVMGVHQTYIALELLRYKTIKMPRKAEGALLSVS